MTCQDNPMSVHKEDEEKCYVCDAVAVSRIPATRPIPTCRDHEEPVLTELYGLFGGVRPQQIVRLHPRTRRVPILRAS